MDWIHKFNKMITTSQANLSRQVQDVIDIHVHETSDSKLCQFPLVSAAILTYNHKDFIREAIDGALLQQASFPFEILIADDCSTDGTTDIIRDYQQQYPEKIRLLIADHNLFGFIPGTTFVTFIALMQSCRGKYMALCEGDDYWTDPLKLQKQVDFLEANPDFTICFHNVEVINTTFPEKNYFINNENTKEVSTLDDLLKGVNYIGTASMMLRANLLPKPLPAWFSRIPFGDYGLSLLFALHGKIKYIDQVMAVYRIHPSGIHGHLTNSPSSLLKAYKEHVKFWMIIRKSNLVKPEDCDFALLKSIKHTIHYALECSFIKDAIIYNIYILCNFRLKYFIHFWKNLNVIIFSFISQFLFQLGIKAKVKNISIHYTRIFKALLDLGHFKK